MIRRTIHIILLLVLPTALFFSCSSPGKKKMNERVSLWRGDKIPYGTYVAYENLQYIFPDAYVSTSKTAPAFVYEDNDYTDTTSEEVDSSAVKEENAYIIIAQQLRPSTEETVALLSRVWRGEHVFIAAASIGKELLDSLHITTSFGKGSYADDSLFHTVYDPGSNDTAAYTYPGYLADNYFTKIDSNITTILGTNSQGKANFIKFSYDTGGSFIINLSPFAFTNFFLLHKQNNSYYNKALSYIPNTVTSIEWDDYFRIRKGDGSDRFSALDFLMKQKAFQWAIPLILILCAILFLVESKRRQRLIPVLPPMHNSSVDFVNTVGRLYFQQKDHRNLAQKMVAHFLDHTRTRYNMSTSVLDDVFIEKLAYKGGFNKEELADLVADINQIDLNDSITEDELFMFSKKLEKFK